MDHPAIMKKSWGLLPKILSGAKSIESRWYINKSAPWGKIVAGDMVYFKNSGHPVTVKAKVFKVLQFSALTPQRVGDLLRKYGQKDGLLPSQIPQFHQLFKNKRYCLLIFLKNPRPIPPFNISKSGFGAMSAWISVTDINQIKLLS